MRISRLREWYDGPEYAAKLQARIEVFNQCIQDPQRIISFAVDKWAANPIDFIEQFGMIINPKNDNEVKPFFLFEYQKDVLKKIWEAELSGNDHEIVIDKPREMGLTWLMVWYYIWRWLFRQNWSGFVLSRSETEVDDGTSDPSKSIFGKIRWSLQYLPEWIMPEGYVPKGKKGTPTDAMLRISNPQMGSSIVGSTSNENAGRGSRFSMIWLDEAFYFRYFLEVLRSITDSSNMKIFISTSKTGRSFEKFVKKCEEKGDHIELKYQDNPFKDEEWAAQKFKDAEFDPEALKELIVGYNISSASQYYPGIGTAAVESVSYSRKFPTYISLDYGRQDHTVIIWWQWDGQYFNILECVSKNKVDFDWFIPFMNYHTQYNPERYSPYNIEVLNKVRAWDFPKAFFGEPAHKQIHYPSNKSIQMELAKYGVRLYINDKGGTHEVRHKALSLILPKVRFNRDSPGVMELYDAIQNSRYAGSVKAVSKESMMKPAHDDETGDYRSAMENGAVNVPRIIRNRSPDEMGGDEKDFSSLIFKSLK